MISLKWQILSGVTIATLNIDCVMKTVLLEQNQIDEIVKLLQSGQTVAIPTETVYGLAADATNDEAIAQIFIAKERPVDHPLIVHVDTFEKIIDLVQDIPHYAQQLAEHFWPGPLTMIFKKKLGVSDLITGGLDTVAIRIPNHPVTLQILKKLGSPVVAPSANAHKRTSPTCPEHVLRTLSGKIAAVVDGGVSSVGIESTIIDMTQQVPIILRSGAITAAMIENILGIAIRDKIDHAEKVSGNMAVHYQPEKPLYLLPLDILQERLKKEHNVAVMHYSPLSHHDNVTYYRMSGDKHEYAQALYATLYTIDSTSVDKIFVENPPAQIEWLDIHDRLVKASCNK